MVLRTSHTFENPAFWSLSLSQVSQQLYFFLGGVWRHNCFVYRRIQPIRCWLWNSRSSSHYVFVQPAVWGVTLRLRLTESMSCYKKMLWCHDGKEISWSWMIKICISFEFQRIPLYYYSTVLKKKNMIMLLTTSMSVKSKPKVNGTMASKFSLGKMVDLFPFLLNIFLCVCFVCASGSFWCISSIRMSQNILDRYSLPWTFIENRYLDRFRVKDVCLIIH